MKADLHVHTDISDSSYDLLKTLKLAKKNNLTHIGIVNHDTIKGLKKAIELGKKQGIKVIPGIEISAFNFKDNKKVHILGFNFDLKGENIKKLCDPLLKRRHENSLLQIDKLTLNGYKIDIKNIFNNAKNSSIVYKQHIMAELINKGYTDEIYSDLYKKLFKNSGICERDIEYVDVFDAVKAIKKDNGIAVLAHPGQLDSYDLIPELVNIGLDGLEIYHEDHKKEDIEKIKDLSEKYNLILTGGSDFHGEYGSDINIGDILSPKEYIQCFDRDIDLDSEKVLEFIESLVKKAGDYIRKLNETLSLNYKNNDLRDIVTKYDVQIEEFIIKEISKKYPAHSFITEEKTSKKQYFSKYTWIIDPIDGTTNFVSIKKDFSISVALFKDKSPFIGVVYDVKKDKIYSAIKNKGAFINGIPFKKKEKKKSLEKSLLDISLNSIDILKERENIDISTLAKHIRGHRSYGAASLSICKIAFGELQIYMSAKLKLWDYAAGITILNELGGCYRYLENEYKFPIDEVIFIASESKEIESGIISKLKKKL
ncbi:MAG: PHP domain-containing protein [Firmicutes bacterium]|nr:PHP domain-containing protein [Bacillota bacterium]